MAKNTVDDDFCFTWGISNLSEMGFVPLYRFMLRTYTDLGLSRQEMLCIIHLASYHYNSPAGESRPSLATVAHHMGYAHKQRVLELIAQLEAKEMLVVKRRVGFTSIYNAAPFAKAAYNLWVKQEVEKKAGEGGTIQSTTQTGSGTPHSTTPMGSGTLQSTGVVLPIVPEEEEEEKEVKEEKKEFSFSLWPDILVTLRGQMTKATFEAHLLGSTATRNDGMITVTARRAYSVEWLDGRLRPLVTRAVERAAGHEVQLVFAAQEA